MNTLEVEDDTPRSDIMGSTENKYGQPCCLRRNQSKAERTPSALCTKAKGKSGAALHHVQPARERKARDQDKLDIVKWETERPNIAVLGASKLKWMGEDISRSILLC